MARVRLGSVLAQQRKYEEAAGAARRGPGPPAGRRRRPPVPRRDLRHPAAGRPRSRAFQQGARRRCPAIRASWRGWRPCAWVAGPVRADPRARARGRWRTRGRDAGSGGRDPRGRSQVLSAAGARPLTGSKTLTATRAMMERHGRDPQESSRAGWAWPSPAGGWRRPSPASANSASSPAPRSTRCSPAGSRTVTRAATAAAPSTRSRSATWPSASGRATSSPAARPRTRLTSACPSTAWSALARSPRICLLGNFVEVFLAREGHSNPVGINYLEKIQTPHLVSIYGAMLAGVGYILMGAGIPLKIPGVLDAYVDHQPATLSALRGRARRMATTRRCTSGRATSWKATCLRSGGRGFFRSSRRTSSRPRC